MTARKQIFCLEYAKDFCEIRALRESGITATGESPLEDAEVLAEIERILKMRARRLCIEGDELVTLALENFEDAKKNHDYKSANASLRLAAELVGKVGEKVVAPTSQTAIQINFNRTEADEDAYIMVQGRDIPKDTHEQPELAGHSDVLPAPAPLPGCVDVSGTILTEVSFADEE